MAGKGQGKQPNTDTKSNWELASTRIGVASAAAGLVVAMLGLPKQVAQAFSKPDAKALAERDDALVRAEASKPRLDVRYELISGENADRLLRGDDRARMDSTRAGVVRMLLSLPVVETDAATAYRRSDSSGNRGTLDVHESTDTAFAEPEVVFLHIENRGARDAANVAVHAEHLLFDTAVRVREGTAGGEDYRTVMRQRSRTSARITIEIPRTLAPGDGVLVPLFISKSSIESRHRWWVVSPSALLPDSLTYIDAIVAKPRTMLVRRMANPTRVADGIVSRG